MARVLSAIDYDELPDVPGWPDPPVPQTPFGIRYWDVWPKDISVARAPVGGNPVTVELSFTGAPDLDCMVYASDDAEIAHVAGGVVTIGMKTGETWLRIWESGHPEHVRVIRAACVPSACTSDAAIQQVRDDSRAGEDTGHYASAGHVHRGANLDEARVAELIEERLADIELVPKWVRSDG